MAIISVVVAAVVVSAVFLVFMGIGRMIDTRDSVKDRLDAIAPVAEGLESLEGESGGAIAKSLSERLNRAISGQAFSTSISTELARANLALTVSEYLIAHALAFGVLFVVVGVVSRNLLFAVLVGGVGLIVPTLYVRTKQAKRSLAFQDQLPDMLTLIVGSLRSGYGITVAMDAVAKQMPAPACEEFTQVVREIALGMSTSQALGNLVRRIRSEDLDLVVTAIAVQYEVGGNLATILETITETVRERVRLKGQMRVLTAQHSMTRLILTALPFGLGAIMYVLNPTYIMALFTPGPTLAIPAVAVVSVAIGYFVMGKLATVEV